ncbi:MAG: isoleucine--tRNA ligase [Pseudomonadota bacterium]
MTADSSGGPQGGGRDYKATVTLPRTDFPMRAGLPKREPEILARWEEMDLFGKLRAASAEREKFILHDGPPYANGHLHIGHALNKMLKDMINRSQQMLGKNAHYVPGWDCHGLPIEWKVEESYRAAGKDKDEVDQVAFRRECRAFAEKWVAIQTEEFKRFGVIGDWERPYLTMSYDAEAQIVREIGKFLMNGGLYAGAKPVLWSVVERTALADAEVEYADHTSTTIWVRFPLRAPSLPELAGASVVIWTTTPWTIPGNRAIGYDSESDYLLLEVTEVGEGSQARLGERILAGEPLAEELQKAAGFTARTLASIPGAQLAGSTAAHPLATVAEAAGGYGFDVPLLPGDFVTMDQGTGFVHVAPGHGQDDWELGRAHGVEVPHTLDGLGVYLPHVPLFAGAEVYTQEGKPGSANGRVIAALDAAGSLLHRGKLRHSYPHSWRSKAPLIFRNTPQWFISMETNELREKALAALDRTRFVPPQGYRRLRSMIEQRPDWCVSRQRLWGVPLPIFVNKQTGEPLRDQAIVDRVAAAFEEEGGDAWFSSPPERWLGNDYAADDYDQIMDVVEVWFDSGSTHSFVLEARPELKWPADLYLEGSDQHRGWFHTSLLESSGTRGRAPFDAVLTHGFTLTEQGHKMSKSAGTGVDPADVIAQSGADILRLWVTSTHYVEDQRIGPDILKFQVDAYRRLRNTLRYLLGALNGVEAKAPETLVASELPELERLLLHRLWELGRLVRQSLADFDFTTINRALHDFCALDLSAFYFDIRKDSLYCDAQTAPRRQACLAVLDQIFSCLTAWLAPILCFTAEEAWLSRGSGLEESVHLRLFPEVPASWQDEALAARWEKIRAVRRVMTGALELCRAEKTLGSSLQARPQVFVEDAELLALISTIDLGEIAITSGAQLERGSGPDEAFRLSEVPGVAVVVAPAEGAKCQRCWQILPEVGSQPGYPDLCQRCAGAVAALDAAGAA